MTPYIGAIDQGTTSTRFMIFDTLGRVIGAAKKEHDQICTQPRWVEHDPVQIWNHTKAVIQEGLAAAGIQGKDLAAVGVTNQRETVLAWDRTTGQPYANAIVWQCARSDNICAELIREGGQDRFRQKTGLPVATYFSGPKIKWLMDHIPGVKTGVEKGRAIFGTMDIWLIWNLTGGPDLGRHVTDVTNASRTLLMNRETLEWDKDILSVLKIPFHTLPAIVPSSDPKAFGMTRADGPFKAALPIGSALGDQQAALFGQTCFEAGEAKNTYGTGCFLLFHTGERIQFSDHGLLTTPAYQISGQKPCYALEGSIAYAGALVQWVRDNLGLIQKASDIEALAKTVADNGDVYCVPAFSGLYAPYWRSDARGVIAGLTQFAGKGHLARAVLEATAFQTKDIVDAVKKEFQGRLDLKSLKVDGGMVENRLLMQFQADILNAAVIRSKISETTALGAAYAAGLAVGVWSGLEELKQNWAVHSTFLPQKDAAWRERLSVGWEKAVQRTLNWK